MSEIYETDQDLYKAVENKMRCKIPKVIFENCIPLGSHSPYGSGDFKETIANLKDAGITPQLQQQLRGDWLRSKLAAKALDPEVRKIREELFGNPNPPFKNLKAVGKWVKTEAASQPPAEGHAPRYGYYFDHSKGPPDETAKELQALLEEKPGAYGIELPVLAVPEENGWTSLYTVSERSRLRRLWLAVRRIAKQLDCQEAQAAGLILTGKTPIVYAISGTTLGTIDTVKQSRGKIVITIRYPVSEKDLTIIYRELRRSLWGKVRSPKPLKELDLRIVEFVEGRIDPDNPRWENLRKEWNRQYPEHRLDLWRDFRRVYFRSYTKIYPDIDLKAILRG